MRWRWLWLVLGIFIAGTASPTLCAPSRDGIVVLALEGTVEVARGGGAFAPAAANQVLLVGDRVRTGPLSRLTLRWTDQSVFRMGFQAELLIEPPPQGKTAAGFDFMT